MHINDIKCQLTTPVIHRTANIYTNLTKTNQWMPDIVVHRKTVC